VLNFLWLGLFAAAFAVAFFKAVVFGEYALFTELISALFSSAKSAFEIALGLTGVLSFWLGMMRIAERSGWVRVLTRFIAPLFSRLMPELPRHHPAMAAMAMNIAANMLGLDNAATPLGIKAMQELQTLNPKPDTASNPQILFLVINTSSVTLFPVAIFTYRAQLGAAVPTDVFIPILMATYCSTLAGLVAVAAVQKIHLLEKTVLAYSGALTLLVAGLLAYFSQLPQPDMLVQSALISNAALMAIIMAFLVGAVINKINAYEAFVEGAKEGFQTAVTIIPYLVAMLVAVAVFRASGALDLLLDSVRLLVVWMGLDGRFVDALPTALVKPFSGGGARAMMIDTMQNLGADSFAGRLACIIQGSTETTFYVLAVYFGAFGIKNSRHAVACGIIADFSGILAAILLAYVFFA